MEGFKNMTITIPIWLFVLFIIASIPGVILLFIFFFWLGLVIRFKAEEKYWIDEQAKNSKCPEFIEGSESE